MKYIKPWNLQIPYLRQVLDFTKDNFVTLNEIGGAGGLFVQVLLTPWLIAKAGEKSTVIVGLSVYIVYMAMYATETVHDPTGAYVNSLIQDVSNVNYPAISSIKSTLSVGNEQGQILGAISAIQSMAGGVGPFIFATLYDISLGENAPFPPRFIWLVGCFIMAGSVAMAFTVPKRSPTMASMACCSTQGIALSKALVNISSTTPRTKRPR